MQFVPRTLLPVAALMPAIKNAVGTQDAAIPVVKLRQMEEVFADSIRRPLLRARTLMAVMTQGLVLAAIGVVGGLVIVLALSRVFASLLFRVEPAVIATMPPAAVSVMASGGAGVGRLDMASVTAECQRSD